MKIVWGALTTDGAGKLGGHAAQHGRAGSILRTIKQPRKSPTSAQSLKRQEIQVISQSWRELTESQRKGWNNNAPIGTSGFDFYMQTNLILLALNLPILSSYITPVDPNYVTTPINQAMNITFDPEFIVGSIYFINNFNSWIFENWSPHILYTGWIPPSVYRYPKMNKLVNINAISFQQSGVQIQIDNTQPIGPIPTAEGYKAKFNVGFINSATGQRSSQGTYEVIATQNFPPALIYNPQTFINSSDLVPVTGGYNLEATFGSSNGTFDFDNWEPWFFMSDWSTNDSGDNLPITNYITPDHFTFIDNENISLLITHAEGSPLAPPGPGYNAGLQIGWKQKGGGQVVSEQIGSFFFDA